MKVMDKRQHDKLKNDIVATQTAIINEIKNMEQQPAENINYKDVISILERIHDVGAKAQLDVFTECSCCF